MQKHNIKTNQNNTTSDNSSSGLFNKLNSVLHRLKQIPLGLYSYIASNGGMNLLRCSRTSSSNFETKVDSVSKLNDYIGKNKFIRVSAVFAIFALAALASATLIPIYNNINTK